MKTNLTDLSEARKVLIKNRDLRRILCEDLATKVSERTTRPAASAEGAGDGG